MVMVEEGKAVAPWQDELGPRCFLHDDDDDEPKPTLL